MLRSAAYCSVRTVSLKESSATGTSPVESAQTYIGVRHSAGTSGFVRVIASRRQ